MPSASNIVLADAQSTPVNHTFKPIGADRNGVFYWEDSSATNQIGNWRISLEIRRPGPVQPGTSSKDRSYKYRLGLHEPILETLGTQTVSGIPPAPTIAYISRCQSDFTLSERTSLQNRKDIVKMAPLLLQDSFIKSSIENLENVW